MQDVLIRAAHLTPFPTIVQYDHVTGVALALRFRLFPFRAAMTWRLLTARTALEGPWIGGGCRDCCIHIGRADGRGAVPRAYLLILLW